MEQGPKSEQSLESVRSIIKEIVDLASAISQFVESNPKVLSESEVSVLEAKLKSVKEPLEGTAKYLITGQK